MNMKQLVLPAILAVGLGSVYFLPSEGKIGESAIKMELPREDGEWMFRKTLPSKDELQALAEDTEFSKAICYRARPGEYTKEGYANADVIDLSVVLSGYDINNSIHRPERCMPAQGHTILSGSDLDIPLSNDRHLTVRRLLSTRKVTIGDQSKDFHCITYYFFVGHDRLAHSHLERTFLDMKDRLIRGMDQRWAYASFSINFGRMPWYEDVEITEKEADQKVTAFVKAFADRQIDWSKIIQ